MTATPPLTDPPPYLPRPGIRDEMVADDGTIRELWVPLHRALVAAGPSGLRRRRSRIARTLEQHGATFNLHGAPEQVWEVDQVPVLIDEQDWTTVEAGLAQRARLQEALLDDLYGPRRLLTDGVLPPDLVLGHRDLLHPLVGLRLPHRRIVLSAADLARTPDGGFVVLAQRTQAPAGAGYALDNRGITAGALPEVARRLGVRELDDWYDRLRAELAALAPPGVDAPRTVILTPGPGSVSYVEHSFLARTLGFTLVRGDDLTVRSGAVYLKAVGGLEPVHVVLRRVDDSWCDPLELRPDSVLGVAGLVEATRRGTVALANALGSGLAEHPGLLAYDEAVMSALLGESPVLPAAPTWWCGDDASRSHVLAHLDRLVVKALDRTPSSPRQSSFGRLLARSRRDELADAIRARPERFVAQEELALATVPAFDGRRLEATHAVLRPFVLTTADGGAHTLPGALTRIAGRPDQITMFSGGGSKDTWVVAGAPVRALTTTPVRPSQIDLRTSVSSRAAESLYWIGRNLERAELLIRAVRAVEWRADRWPDLGEEADGAWHLTMDGFLEALAGVALPSEPGAVERPTVGGLLLDDERPRSLVNSLHHLLRGVADVRELFSTETWRVLNELRVAEDELGRDGTEVTDDVESLLTTLSAFSGLAMESMVRDPGWRFMDIGRRVERSLLLSASLRSTMATPPVEAIAPSVYGTVLASWDSLVAYRRRHRSDIEPGALLALLLTEGRNPRALAFQLERIAEDLADVPAVGGRAAAAPGEIDRLASKLAATNTSDLVVVGPGGEHDRLVRFLDLVDHHLLALAESVELGWFAHIGQVRLVGEATPWR